MQKRTTILIYLAPALALSCASQAKCTTNLQQHTPLLHAHKGPADSGCPRRSCRHGAVVPGGSWRALFASPPPLYLSTGQSNRRRPQRAAGRGILTSLCGKVSDAVAGFNPPADQEAAPAACRQEFGVSTAFAGDCGGYSSPWFRRGAWVREPGSADGADTRRVYGQLLAVVRLQSIGHDFNSASIGDGAGNVHVCHCNIASYSASRFSADLGHGGFPAPGLSPPTRRLWRTRLGDRHTGQGHCHSHTALVRWAMASGGGATGPHGSAGLGVLIPGSGEHCKCSTCVATCLGVQQGLRCGGKGCKEHLGRALVSGLACRCHPRMGSPGSGAACSG